MESLKLVLNLLFTCLTSALREQPLDFIIIIIFWYYSPVFSLHSILPCQSPGLSALSNITLYILPSHFQLSFLFCPSGPTLKLVLVFIVQIFSEHACNKLVVFKDVRYIHNIPNL